MFTTEDTEIAEKKQKIASGRGSYITIIAMWLLGQFILQELYLAARVGADTALITALSDNGQVAKQRLTSCAAAIGPRLLTTYPVKTESTETTLPHSSGEYPGSFITAC